MTLSLSSRPLVRRAAGDHAPHGQRDAEGLDGQRGPRVRRRTPDGQTAVRDAGVLPQQPLGPVQALDGLWAHVSAGGGHLRRRPPPGHAQTRAALAFCAPRGCVICCHSGGDCQFCRPVDNSRPRRGDSLTLMAAPPSRLGARWDRMDVFTGPGGGIQLQRGPRAGRLLVRPGLFLPQ